MAPTAALATTKTTTDVNTLATTESNVVSILCRYKATAAWQTKFEAAITAHNAALVKVNADLGPKHPSQVLLSQKGSGAAGTAKFTVPTAAKGWRLAWSYSCASFGGRANFQVYINRGTGSDLGTKSVGHGGGFYDSGTFYLQVTSECSWSIQAVAGG